MPHYDLILKKGLAYLPAGAQRADVALSNGRIAAIGDLGEATADEVVDVDGLAVLPGTIDTQVHFREPGMEPKEDIESGTRSAVLGGVTTVFEMPNTNPPTASREALEDKVRRAHGRAHCNIAFFVGATSENAHELGELEALPGSAGIKVFMGSSTGSLLVADDATLLEVLKHGRRRMPIHAEDWYRLEQRKPLISGNPSVLEHPFLRDAETARLATERILRLARAVGRSVHILHVSTLDELPLLKGSKGFGATAEVTPQHLWFFAPDCYERLGSLAQMNPPIRSIEHRNALREGLRRGIFEVFGSDHAPHTLEEKAKPYPGSPSGMPGVQTLLPAVLTLASDEGLLDVEDAIRMLTEAPARIYGTGNKGKLEVGFDADIAIVDLEGRHTVERSWISSKCGWSPFEGLAMIGFPVHTIVNGSFAVREGELMPTCPGNIVEFDVGSTRDRQ